MKTKIAAMMVGALCLGPITAGHAGLSPQEKSLWGASEQAPTTFALPAGQDGAVMAKALSLIGGWGTMDRYMAPMPVQTSTTTLIETAEPTALNLFGFKVLDTRTASGSVITVDTSAFEGKAFEISRQHKDANKRAHLLAFLLEQYAGVPTTPLLPTPMLAVPPSTTSAPVTNLGTPDPFGPSLEKLRSQLGAGQYNDALQTLDSLRTAVAGHAGTVAPGGN